MQVASARKQRLRKVVRSLMLSGDGAPLADTSVVRVAMVATVKGVAPTTMRAWCSYHRSVGFAQLFLYFDGGKCECEGSGVSDIAGVLARPVDDDLRAEWRQLAGASDWLPTSESEVQARQALNALHALRESGRLGCTWLLHCDADELFYPGPGVSDVREHFALLDERGAECFTYANLEAVPEAVCSCDDASEPGHPFRHVTLFKQNPSRLPTTPAALAALDFWQARAEPRDRSVGPSTIELAEDVETANADIGAVVGGMASRDVAGDDECASDERRTLFLYYSNGKSAVRVRERAQVLSVHEWIPGTAKGLSVRERRVEPGP